MVNGKQEKGQTYVKGQDYDIPIYFDNEQQAPSVYGILSIPDTLFIDSDGNIVNAYQGMIDEKTLIPGIKKVGEWYHWN